MLHTMRNEFCSNMASMAIKNKEAVKSWVCRPCYGLENRTYPFVRMAIRRPAAVTR